MENKGLRNHEKDSIYKKVYITKNSIDTNTNTNIEKGNNTVLNLTTVDTIVSSIVYYKSSKLEFFKTIITNPFMGEMVEGFKDVFCEIKRMYNAFSLLARLWKWKHTKVYNTEDLYMTPLSMYDKNTVAILQNKTIYLFSIRELIMNITTEISNSLHFFADPSACKNPYTNLPFDKSVLYNIYFKIRESNYKFPELFHRFFLTDFDLTKYINENTYLIREQAIKTVVNNLLNDDIHDMVLVMFDEHGFRNFRINKLYPPDKLKREMKPYLLLFYESRYSLNISKARYCKEKLYSKLYELYNTNPQFGRMILKRQGCSRYDSTCKKRKFVEGFKDKIPTFEILQPFLSSHLEVVDETFHQPTSLRSFINVARETILQGETPSDEDSSAESSSESSISIVVSDHDEDEHDEDEHDEDEHDEHDEDEQDEDEQDEDEQHEDEQHEDEQDYDEQYREEIEDTGIDNPFMFHHCRQLESIQQEEEEESREEESREEESREEEEEESIQQEEEESREEEEEI